LSNTVKAEIEDFEERLRTYGPKTIHNLLSAFLIWLFGNLVFIPIASSLSWQARAFCTLIFFVAFTLLVLRALPGLKNLIDAFTIPLARKYGLKKGLTRENSLVLFRHILYIISVVILYLLYLPFLANFHPAISGIILILMLIWIFFLGLRILLILSSKILEWLYA